MSSLARLRERGETGNSRSKLRAGRTVYRECGRRALQEADRPEVGEHHALLRNSR